MKESTSETQGWNGWKEPRTADLLQNNVHVPFWLIYSKYLDSLTPSILVKISTEDILTYFSYFFLFFLENKIWNFMQIVSLAWSDPFFLEKQEKYHQ